MRVLILGCGYVGLPLGAELARQGHSVFGLRRNPGPETALRQAGIEPLRADITEPEELARLPGGYDWVVHCVSSGGGGAGDYRRVYLRGTQNVLEWLADAPPSRFVYTSSTSVYGQDDGSIVDETSLTRPEADTARVLLETEQLLLQAGRQAEFPAILLRVAGIYGPNRGYWFKKAAEGQARVTGKGDRILNMIHRDDVVGVINAALLKGRLGEIYNAVDDEPVAQRDFLEWLAARLDKPLLPSLPEDAEERKRGSTNKRVSNQKLKAELGYQFKYPSYRQGYAGALE